MAVAGAGSAILRARWLSPLIKRPFCRPLNGWGRCSISSSANCNAEAAEDSKKHRTTFFLYMAEQQKTPGVPQFHGAIDRSKYFSEQWKQLSEQDKEKYRSVAAQNLAKYVVDRHKERLAQPEQAALQKEKKRFRLFKLHAKSLKKERELSQMPQKPLSGYSRFISEMCKKETGSYPSQLEVIRNANQQWKVMASEEKQPYLDAAAEQRAKYDAEMESWVRRVEAEGKGHLIPGREPTMSIPVQSPFAQAVIKAVKATTKEAVLSENTIDAILAFICEKLTAIEEANQLDAQQIIRDFARDWVNLTPAQRKRYGVSPAAAPNASPTTTGDQKVAGSKEHEIDSKAPRQPSPRKSRAKSPRTDAAAAEVAPKETKTSESAARQKAGASGRSRRASAAGDSDSPVAGRAKTDESEPPMSGSDQQPAKQSKKRRPVDSSTTSSDTD